MRKRKKKYKPLADQYRHGYDPLFLGEDYRIDLPKLSQAMEEDSTKMKNGSNILNYVHFPLSCVNREDWHISQQSI